MSDCEAIAAAAERCGKLLTVGFNRRFSPWAKQAKSVFATVPEPRMLLYRVNADILPPGHWSTDPVEGGGRILGEAVHFFDMCCWFLDQSPVAVSASRVGIPSQAEPQSAAVIADDNLTALLRFPSGALATVVYCSVGHPGVSKEVIELFGGQGVIVVDNFQGIQFAGLPGKSVRAREIDKGMQGMLDNFVRAIRGEAELEVTAAHGLRATRIAEQVLREARRV